MASHCRATASLPCPRAAVAVGLAVALLAAAGCDTGDGRELRPPPPGATAPPPPTVTTASTVGVPSGPAAEGFVLVSDAFRDGTAVPADHACDGADVSPPLAWSGVPAGTVELAITVVDESAGGFVHWILAGIDPVVTGLEPGGFPEGAAAAVNGFGTVGWQGPCPPEGETHTYRFTLHALGQPSGVRHGRPAEEALSLIDAATLATATLSPTYGRPAPG